MGANWIFGQRNNDITQEFVFRCVHVRIMVRMCLTFDRKKRDDQKTLFIRTGKKVEIYFHFFFTLWKSFQDAKQLEYYKTMKLPILADVGSERVPEKRNFRMFWFCVDKSYAHKRKESRLQNARRGITLDLYQRTA